jgi:hypothetical protein
MSRNQFSPPCEIGDHKHHYRVVHSVGEGMFGGVVCPCKGECRKGAAQRRESTLRRMGLGRLGGRR